MGYQREPPPSARRPGESVAITKKKNKEKEEKGEKEGEKMKTMGRERERGGEKTERKKEKRNSFNGNLNFSAIDDVPPVGPRHCAKNKLSNKSFP